MPHTQPREKLYRRAARAAVLGVAVNFALGAVKLVGGILGHSVALVSDAVNSLGDTLTSAVVFVSLRIAQRPADREHPYGHTRAEAIAGSNVAVLVMVSALLVGWEAIRHVAVEHPAPPVWTLWIAAGTLVIKESLYRYKMFTARQTGSSALVAVAWDHRADALCSLAVLVGLALVRWGGPSWAWADEAAALVVVTAILITGARLFRHSGHELLDAQADRELVSSIRAEARGVEGVRGVEKLWVRKSGLEYFVDIHLEVDPQLTVADGHLIGHNVKDRLQAKFTTLRDVLVHLEPFPHVDP